MSEVEVNCPLPALEPSAIARHELAPTGVLRVAINFGNPVLVQKDAATGALSGITLDLAEELARRLGVARRIEEFHTAGKAADLALEDRWDMAFLAIDPLRSAKISFSEPYIGIEGCYMVPADSPLQHADEVDTKGIRISVGQNTATDLHLSRTIRHAHLLRVDGSVSAIECFRDNRLEATGGLRQALDQFMAKNVGYRILAGSFLLIRHAVALPAGRNEALLYVDQLLSELKGSGFIDQSLKRHGQTSVL